MGARVNAERVVFGVGLIALGTFWLLANAGWIDLLATLRRWWPSILVVWGLLELYNVVVDRQGPAAANPIDPPIGEPSAPETEARP